MRLAVLALVAASGCFPPDKPPCEKAADDVSARFGLEPTVRATFLDACSHWTTFQLACVNRAETAAQIGPCVGTSPLPIDAGVHKSDVRRLTHADAMTIDAAPADAAIDATPEADTASAFELRTLDYALLVALDFDRYDTLLRFPGAPAGRAFVSTDYHWRLSSWRATGDLPAVVTRVTATIDAPPELGSEPKVRPLAKALAAWTPRIVALQQYYNDKRFVDDEFDRGRREAPDMTTAKLELARLRPAMRAAVLAQWHELVTQYRGSPRGNLARVWEACVALADNASAGATGDALATGISECRRSIAAIDGVAVEVATGTYTHERLDIIVRQAVARITDGLTRARRYDEISEAIGVLTNVTLEAWPKLPGRAAEKP